jgi:hypothetical protein
VHVRAELDIAPVDRPGDAPGLGLFGDQYIQGGGYRADAQRRLSGQRSARVTGRCVYVGKATALCLCALQLQV